MNTETPTPPIDHHEDEPVLSLIKQIKDNTLNPKSLSPEECRRCVDVLWSEGYSAAEMAQIFKTSERTIYRIRKELRDSYALRVDPADARPHAGDTPARKEITTLDVGQAGISSIVWATGFRRQFDWIRSPSIAPGGDPVHVRGVSTQPGLFFLGLRWLHTRRSNFIDGAGADAAYVRDQILRRAGQN